MVYFEAIYLTVFTHERAKQPSSHGSQVSLPENVCACGRRHRLALIKHGLDQHQIIQDAQNP